MGGNTCDATKLMVDLCLSNIDGEWWGLCIEMSVLLYCFLALAIVCDDFLVKSLEVLCLRWDVPEDIAGASFMAFGSAAPEIIVNAVTTLKSANTADSDATSLGVGAIIGSGMIAFLVIPGACGVVAGRELQRELMLKRRPLVRDVGTYCLGLFQLCYYFHDGEISMLESALLLGSYFSYLLVLVCSPNLRQWYRTRVMHRPRSKRQSFVLQAEQAGQLDEGLLESHNPFACEVSPSVGQHSAVENSSIMSLRDLQIYLAQMDLSSAAEPGCCEVVLKWLCAPAQFAFEWTCPDCGRGGRWEWAYPITFLISFVWVSMFSFIISSIVGRFSALSGLNGGFFGLFVIALGAEIPDMVQSVTVARKGYGSMAVSNCTGSQIVNIMIGLGLPWFLSNLLGQPVQIVSHKDLQVAAFFQVAAIMVNALLLLGVAFWKGENKAVLGQHKGLFFLLFYLSISIGYAVASILLPQ